MGGITQPTPSALVRFAMFAGGSDSATTGLACVSKETATIPATTIATGDEIIAMINFATTSNVATDVTAASAIGGLGIQCATSTSDIIGCFWMAKTSDAYQVASPKIMTNLVRGHATTIACAGITTDDDLICVLRSADTSGAPTDVTDLTTISSDGNLTFSSTTADGALYVMWMSKSNIKANANLAMKFAIATAGSSPSDTVTVTGIRSGDDIISALAVDETSALPVEESSALVTITADDTITIDSTSPTEADASTLWVFWHSSETGEPGIPV